MSHSRLLLRQIRVYKTCKAYRQVGIIYSSSKMRQCLGGVIGKVTFYFWGMGKGSKEGWDVEVSQIKMFKPPALNAGGLLAFALTVF